MGSGETRSLAFPFRCPSSYIFTQHFANFIFRIPKVRVLHNDREQSPSPCNVSWRYGLLPPPLRVK